MALNFVCNICYTVFVSASFSLSSSFGVYVLRWRWISDCKQADFGDFETFLFLKSFISLHVSFLKLIWMKSHQIYILPSSWRIRSKPKSHRRKKTHTQQTTWHDHWLLYVFSTSAFCHLATKWSLIKSGIWLKTGPKSKFWCHTIACVTISQWNALRTHSNWHTEHRLLSCLIFRYSMLLKR